VRQEAVDRGIQHIGLSSSVQAAHRVVTDLDAAHVRMRTALAAVVTASRWTSWSRLRGGEPRSPRSGTPARSRRRARVHPGVRLDGEPPPGIWAAGGVRVVGIATCWSSPNPAGLDVERLLLTRKPGASWTAPAAREEPGTARGAVAPGCRDVLVPAAASYCIDAGTSEQVAATVNVEAANMRSPGGRGGAAAARVVTPRLPGQLGDTPGGGGAVGDIDGTAAESSPRSARGSRR